MGCLSASLLSRLQVGINYLGGFFLFLLEDMPVDSQRGGHIAMAGNPLDYLGLHSLRQHERDAGVSQVMEPERGDHPRYRTVLRLRLPGATFRHADSLTDSPEAIIAEVAGVNRRIHLRRKHQVIYRAKKAENLQLLELLPLPPFQRFDRHSRQGMLRTAEPVLGVPQTASSFPSRFRTTLRVRLAVMVPSWGLTSCQPNTEDLK